MVWTISRCEVCGDEYLGDPGDTPRHDAYCTGRFEPLRVVALAGVVAGLRSRAMLRSYPESPHFNTAADYIERRYADET